MQYAASTSQWHLQVHQLKFDSQHEAAVRCGSVHLFQALSHELSTELQNIKTKISLGIQNTFKEFSRKYLKADLVSLATQAI